MRPPAADTAARSRQNGSPLSSSPRLYGGRRNIPWEALADCALSLAQRQIVGQAWRWRMGQEHLAAGLFAQLASDLAAEGCDPAVLALLTRAAWDEVSHAELCRRVAVQLLGEAAVPQRLKGRPVLPAYADLPLAQRALLQMVDTGCLSETLTSVYFAETLAQTTHPTMHAVFESLLEDEVDHGRVGWAHLAAVLAEGWGSELVAQALPALLERQVAPVIDTSWNGPEDPLLTAYGWLSPRAGADIYRRALVEVILPGFTAAGIDVSAAEQLAHSRGWLPR